MRVRDMVAFGAVVSLLATKFRQKRLCAFTVLQQRTMCPVPATKHCKGSGHAVPNFLGQPLARLVCVRTILEALKLAPRQPIDRHGNVHITSQKNLSKYRDQRCKQPNVRRPQCSMSRSTLMALGDAGSNGPYRCEMGIHSRSPCEIWALRTYSAPNLERVSDWSWHKRTGVPSNKVFRRPSSLCTQVGSERDGRGQWAMSTRRARDYGRVFSGRVQCIHSRWQRCW